MVFGMIYSLNDVAETVFGKWPVRPVDQAGTHIVHKALHVQCRLAQRGNIPGGTPRSARLLGSLS